MPFPLSLTGNFSPKTPFLHTKMGFLDLTPNPLLAPPNHILQWPYIGHCTPKIWASKAHLGPSSMWAFFGFLAGEFFWKNFASGENQISQIFLRNHPFWMVNGSKLTEGGQFWPPKIRFFLAEPKSSFLGVFYRSVKYSQKTRSPC